MNINLNLKRGVRTGDDVFSAKETEGTRFAKELLERTYKRIDGDGNRIMLVPPPLRMSRRGER